MRTEIIMAFVCSFGLVAPRVVRNDIWVEARAPLTIVRGQNHHHIRRPHLDLDLMPPTKLYPKSTIRFTELAESFRNSDYENAPQAASLQIKNSDERDVCEPEKVRICEHCLKITRAPQAYQECCADLNNAFSWCQRIYTYSHSN